MNEPKVSSDTGDVGMPVEIPASQLLMGTPTVVVAPSTGEQSTVKIPALTPEGTRLRVRRMGASSAKGTRRDLYLKVRVCY
jgi:DnaJ-class molecular chaperone